MYKNHNYIPTIFEVNALCKCNDFFRSFGTSMIFFFFLYKMTPALLQGAVWGYVALCDSSRFGYYDTACIAAENRKEEK